MNRKCRGHYLASIFYKQEGNAQMPKYSFISSFKVNYLRMRNLIYVYPFYYSVVISFVFDFHFCLKEVPLKF